MWESSKRKNVRNLIMRGIGATASNYPLWRIPPSSCELTSPRTAMKRSRSSSSSWSERKFMRNVTWRINSIAVCGFNSRKTLHGTIPVCCCLRATSTRSLKAMSWSSWTRSSSRDKRIASSLSWNRSGPTSFLASLSSMCLCLWTYSNRDPC